jgi:TonB family protein
LHGNYQGVKRFVFLTGLSLLVIPPCVAQQQNQPANPKCAPVSIRKIESELPKDLKGFRSGPSIRYIIEMDGSVSNVSLVKGSGSKAVDDALLDAVKKASYRPLKTGCGPVETTIKFNIDFTADNSS